MVEKLLKLLNELNTMGFSISWHCCDVTRFRFHGTIMLTKDGIEHSIGWDDKKQLFVEFEKEEDDCLSMCGEEE